MSKQGKEIQVINAWKIAGQLGLSLNQIHQNEIIHGDLKPENVLLTKDFQVKLVDFGLSRMLKDGKTSTVQYGGTLYYFAPEYIGSQKLEKSDKTENLKDHNSEKDKREQDDQIVKEKEVDQIEKEQDDQIVKKEKIDEK
ncbi:MAG: hypothetical protein EZS28_052481, partial [Streblomastix strix]